LIIPCIDLMEGKVVQLVQGRQKVLEGKSLDEMLSLFEGFPEIQVIDLDAAMNRGSNLSLVEYLAARAKIRVGGGVRTVERAETLLAQGAYRVIVGTAAFSSDGPNTKFLEKLSRTVGHENVTIALDSKDGRIVVKGWREATKLTAANVIVQLEPYCSGFLCTYVDKEGMMDGTDIDWFRSLRDATSLELTGAGGITTLADVEALSAMDIHCAIGMAIYTGRLNLDELREINLIKFKRGI
jgi:phosphoribosylformimino-5-aminoimidazole carboxamide ribotide isomerase